MSRAWRAPFAFAFLPFAICAELACGPAPQTNMVIVAPANSQTPNSDDRSKESFAELEVRALRRAGVADARLAQRTGLEPSEADLDSATMSVIAGDKDDAIVIDGTLDPFSFDARAKMLASALALAKTLPDKAGEPDEALERALVLRLLEEEIARVAEERALPESASTLVDAMTSTLAEGGDMSKRDKWMSRRLDAIAEAYRAHPLHEVERAELDDALDPLEKEAIAYPLTLVSLSHLRDLLEALRFGLLPASKAPAMNLYSTHIDPRPTSLSDLDARAVRLVADLSRAIHAKENAMRDADVRRVETEAGNALVVRTPCRFDAEGGRVRKMTSSREREDACRLVHAVAVADEKDDAQALFVLLVLRDRANMARFITAPEGARPQHPFLSTVAMPDARKLERNIVAHPAAALGALVAVGILENDMRASDAARDPHDSFVERKARALAWEKIGDAPLDVIADRLK